MSEAIAAFQSQLSGLMETVFKAAMYEIVRLVEDSFVEEVSRSREQVEALRKRLQWAEGRRRGRGMARCAQCGWVAATCGDGGDGRPERGGGERRDLKQKGGPEGRWCREEVEPHAVRGREVEVMPSAVKAAESAGAENSGGGAVPKEEMLEEPCVEGVEDPDSLRLHSRDFREDLDTRCPPLAVTDQRGAFSLLCTPPPKPGHVVKRLSPGGIQQCTSKTQAMGGQQRTTSALECGSPEEVSHMKPWPVAECLSTARSLHCKLKNDPGDSLLIKQEEEGHLAEWGRSEDAVVQERLCGEHQAIVNNHSGTELDVSSSEHVSRALGACLKWVEPQLQVGTQRQASLGEPISVMVTVKGGVEAPVEGPGSLNRKFVVSAKNSEGHMEVCTTDKQLSCVHLGRAGRTPHSCSQCGKSFSHSCHLKAHQQIHTGERPFVCTLCGRSFTKLSNLKAHRRVHTGERPYICTACGKRFTQKCNLKRHQRIHADDTLFACT